MGTQNNSLLPNFNSGAGQPGQVGGTPGSTPGGGIGGIFGPGGITGLIQSLMGPANGLMQGKSQKMGGAQTPKDYGLPSLKDVPHAQGDFYQQQAPDARMTLLRTMMERAKNGGLPPTTPAAGG